jgi:hypothetical protein
MLPQTIRETADEPQFCYMTTTGRTSGRRHTIEIWFAAIGSTIYVISGGGPHSDRVKNLSATTPHRSASNTDHHDVARLPLAPSEERDRVVRHLHAKYESQVSRSVHDWLRDAYIVALDSLR